MRGDKANLETLNFTLASCTRLFIPDIPFTKFRVSIFHSTGDIKNARMKKEKRRKKEGNADVIGNAANTRNTRRRRGEKSNVFKGQADKLSARKLDRPIFFRLYRGQDQLLIKARIKPDSRYLFYISTSLPHPCP